ncbi:hypothetical protein AB0X98_00150 [Rothia koreensis]|jgi:hypothetical protein|uniref:hypothetical protein n=1 Tax=Rothia koreensis TaxID=592378 RepID=UPI003F1F3FF1
MFSETPMQAELLDSIRSQMNWAENGWIVWAWTQLDRHEAGCSNSEADHVEDIILIAALGHLYEHFQELNSGLNGLDEVIVDPLGADRPFVSEIELARVCERNGLEPLFYPETAVGLVQLAVPHFADVARKRLKELLGTARLFTSLSTQALHIQGIHGVEDEDTEDGHVHTESAFDPNSTDSAKYDDYMSLALSPAPNAMRAFEWLDGRTD